MVTIESQKDVRDELLEEISSAFARPADGTDSGCDPVTIAAVLLEDRLNHLISDGATQEVKNSAFDFINGFLWAMDTAGIVDDIWRKRIWKKIFLLWSGDRGRKILDEV